MIGAWRAKTREDKGKQNKTKETKNNNLAFFLCSFYSCFPPLTG